VEEGPRRLTKTVLVETGEFGLERVECRCRRTGWSRPETAGGYGIVFVRRGCFHRRLNGTEFFVDPTVAYFERPDDEQQISHPAGGDACTVLYLTEAMVACLWGGELGLPDDTVPTDPAIDLLHRQLLARAGRSAATDVAEAVIAIATGVLARSSSRRVASGRPTTALARRRVVADAREALVQAPALGVIELARRVSVSPHHLSRVFKAETGETISTYRNRLRVRLALQRLSEGEPCLARLAADLGFADQAHLARVVRREHRMPPSRLRERITT
jgi:AraC-like DNA-binding protein